MNLFKIGLAFAVAALIVGTGTVAGLFWHFSHGLPDHKQLADYQPPITSRLYAADGRLLAEYAKEKRVFVPAAAIPRRVKQAFVAAEDQRFFTHPGIDVLGLTRAVLTNIANPGRRMEGASGITQQVAKNFLLTNQATLARKIREAILAFRIEKAYSKEHILELYLNEIYLGAGNYGVGAAAMNYFDRSLGELSLSEIAYLAALPKAPNAYNINRHEKEAYIRRDYVLGRMQADGYITAVTPLKPGAFRKVTLALAMWGIAKLVQYWFRPGFVLNMGTIHYARWFRLPESEVFVFFSNYDGSWLSYLEDFITKAHQGQSAAWSNGRGFPRTKLLIGDGAQDGDRFKRWVRRQQVPTQFWYNRYPKLTTDEIRRNAMIHDGLVRANTDTAARAWLGCFGSMTRPVDAPRDPAHRLGADGVAGAGVPRHGDAAPALPHRRVRRHRRGLRLLLGLHVPHRAAATGAAR